MTYRLLGLWIDQIDHGRREKDGHSAHYLTESDTLAPDDGGEYLAAVLETDEVGGSDGHPADKSNGQGYQVPVWRCVILGKPHRVRYGL